MPHFDDPSKIVALSELVAHFGLTEPQLAAFGYHYDTIVAYKPGEFPEYSHKVVVLDARGHAIGDNDIVSEPHTLLVNSPVTSRINTSVIVSSPEVKSEEILVSSP